MTIADEKYVSFTTFRRTGEPVATPVWIAPLREGRAGFTTGATSGKAKRLAHTSTVTLQPCNQRGVLIDGSQQVAGTARIVTAPAEEFDEVTAAIKAKYRWAATAIAAAGKVNEKVRGGRAMSPNAVVVIEVDEL